MLQPTVIKKSKGKAKAKAKFCKPKGKAKAKEVEWIEVEDSELLKTRCRVVAEESGADLYGRAGRVAKVLHQKDAPEEIKYSIIEESKNGKTCTFFHVLAKHVKPEPVVPVPKSIAPVIFDYRQFRGDRKREIVHALDSHANPDNLEVVRENELVEHSTIRAALFEMELRLKCNRVLLLAPQQCVGLEHAVEDLGGEVLKFKQSTKNYRRVICFVWSQGPPRHYTWLQISQLQKGLFSLEYRDSLPAHAPRNLEAAKRVATHLGHGHLCQDLAPCNKVFQRDGWSCGLWCLQWTEQSIRAERGEPAFIYYSLRDLIARTNEFISKCKPQAPKATPKEDAEATEPVAKKAKKIEPEWPSLQEALEAAHKCTKCLPTKKGSKGCTTCMGKWFEEIRQKQTPNKWLKTIEQIQPEKGEEASSSIQ